MSKAECINMHYWETGIFGAKNTVNRFYNTASSSRFSRSSISHKESHQRKAIRLATSTFFQIFRKKPTLNTHNEPLNKHTDYIIPGIQQKKPSRIILKAFLRCVRDSNSWPPAWQAGILTNWTNAPVKVEMMRWTSGAYETRTRDLLRDRQAF